MAMKLWNLNMVHNQVTKEFPSYNYGDNLLIYAKEEQEARQIAVNEMGVEVRHIWESAEHSTCVVVKTPRKSGLFAVIAGIQ